MTALCKRTVSCQIMLVLSINCSSRARCASMHSSMPPSLVAQPSISATRAFNFSNCEHNWSYRSRVTLTVSGRLRLALCRPDRPGFPDFLLLPSFATRFPMLRRSIDGRPGQPLVSL